MGRAWDTEGGRVGGAWEKRKWKGLTEFDGEVVGLGSGQGLGDWGSTATAHLSQGPAGQSHIGVDESPPGRDVSVLAIADLGRFPGGHSPAESLVGQVGPFHLHQRLPCPSPPRRESSPLLIGPPRANGNSPPGLPCLYCPWSTVPAGTRGCTEWGWVKVFSPTPASYALFPRPRPCLVPFQPGSGVSLSLLPRSFL